MKHHSFQFIIVAIILIIPVPVKADSCFLKMARVTGHNVLGKDLTEKEAKQITDMITIGVNNDLLREYTYQLNYGDTPKPEQRTWSRKVALDSERVDPENIEYIWNRVRNIILEAGGEDLKEQETHFPFLDDKWSQSGYLTRASDRVKAKLPEIEREIAPLKRLAESLVSLARKNYPEAKRIAANLVFTPDEIGGISWHQHPKELVLVTQLKEGGKMTRLNNEMKPERGDIVALVGPHASAEPGTSEPRIVLVVFIDL